MRRRWAFTIGVAGLLSLIGFVALIASGVFKLGTDLFDAYDDLGLVDFWPFWTLVLVFAFPLFKVAERLFPSPPGSSTFDPNTADIPSLLAWLEIGGQSH